MKNKLIIFVFLFVILATQVSAASSCSYLRCSNFTNSDKRSDCRYVWSSDLSKNEKQEILCELWKGSYDFNVWQPQNNSPSVPDLSMESKEIDNSSFILAGKIIVFLLFNYLIFSLAKSSYLRKWLVVDS